MRVRASFKACPLLSCGPVSSPACCCSSRKTTPSRFHRRFSPPTPLLQARKAVSPNKLSNCPGPPVQLYCSNCASVNGAMSRAFTDQRTRTAGPIAARPGKWAFPNSTPPIRFLNTLKTLTNRSQPVDDRDTADLRVLQTQKMTLYQCIFSKICRNCVLFSSHILYSERIYKPICYYYTENSIDTLQDVFSDKRMKSKISQLARQFGVPKL